MPPSNYSQPTPLTTTWPTSLTSAVCSSAGSYSDIGVSRLDNANSSAVGKHGPTSSNDTPHGGNAYNVSSKRMKQATLTTPPHAKATTNTICVPNKKRLAWTKSSTKFTARATIVSRPTRRKNSSALVDDSENVQICKCENVRII